MAQPRGTLTTDLQAADASRNTPENRAEPSLLLKDAAAAPDQKPGELSELTQFSGTHNFAPFSYATAESHQELPEMITSKRGAHSVDEILAMRAQPLDLFAPSVQFDDLPASNAKDGSESDQFLGMSDRSFAELNELRNAESVEDTLKEDQTVADSVVELGGPPTDHSNEHLYQEALGRMALPLQDIVRSLNRITNSMMEIQLQPPRERAFSEGNSVGENYSRREGGASELYMREGGHWYREYDRDARQFRPEDNNGGAVRQNLSALKPDIRLVVTPHESYLEDTSAHQPFEHHEHHAEFLEVEPPVSMQEAQEPEELAKPEELAEETDSLVSGDEAPVQSRDNQAKSIGQTVAEASEVLAAASASLVEFVESGPSLFGLSTTEPDQPEDLPLEQSVDSTEEEKFSDASEELPAADVPAHEETGLSLLQRMGLFLKHSIENFVAPHERLAEEPKAETVDDGAQAPEAQSTKALAAEPAASSDLLHGITESLHDASESQHSGMALEEMPDSALTPHSYELSYPRMAYSDFLERLEEEVTRRASFRDTPPNSSDQETSTSSLQRVSSGGFEPSEHHDESLDVAPDVQVHRAKLHALHPKKKQSEKQEEELFPGQDSLSSSPVRTDQKYFLEAAVKVISAIFAVDEVYLSSMAGHMSNESFADEIDNDPKTPSGHLLLDTESVESIPKYHPEDHLRDVHSEPAFEGDGKNVSFMQRHSSGVPVEPGDLSGLPTYYAAEKAQTDQTYEPFGCIAEPFTTLESEHLEALGNHTESAQNQTENESETCGHLRQPFNIPVETEDLPRLPSYASPSGETQVKNEPENEIEPQMYEEDASPLTPLEEPTIIEKTEETIVMSHCAGPRVGTSESLEFASDLWSTVDLIDNLPPNFQSVEMAEVYQRLLHYTALPPDSDADMDFAQDSPDLHEDLQEVSAPESVQEVTDDGNAAAVVESHDNPEDIHHSKKRFQKLRQCLRAKDSPDVKSEDAFAVAEECMRHEMYQRHEMYRQLAKSSTNQLVPKKKSSMMGALGKLFHRKESDKKEAKTARSSEQDVARSAEQLTESRSLVDEDDDDVEPLGMPIRHSPGMLSFPDLSVLTQRTDAKSRSRFSLRSPLRQNKDGRQPENRNEFSAPLLSTSGEYDAIYLRPSSPASQNPSLQTPDSSNPAAEPGLTDSVQIERTGIAHIDMSLYEPSSSPANYAGDSKEPEFWGSMPGGPGNLPIDMDAIHGYKKFVEYGGRYGEHSSLILLWACYLPCRFAANYQYTMEHLFRYVATCLDLLAEEKYKVVYFNGAMPSGCEPPQTWMHDTFLLMDNERTKRTLEKLIIVHSDAWFKAQMKLMDTTHLSKHFLNKVEYVNNLVELQQVLTPQVMEFMSVPEKIREFDADAAHRRHGGAVSFRSAQLL